VKQLSKAAGRHRKDLLRAAAAIRSAGGSDEIARVNLANRLLIAAANRQQVEPLTADRVAWFQRTQELEQIPVRTAFTRLALLEPRLNELEQTVKDASTDVGSHSGDKTGLTEELIDQIESGLRFLVGPDAESADPIVRSRLAADICRRSLLTVIGVIHREDNR
jgi:hypothetical protein